MDMTALSHIFSVVSDRAAEMAIALLWQGALIAFALAMCLRVLPRISAAYRFAAWAAGFVALVSLPLFSFLPRISGGAAHVVATQVTTNATRSWLSVDFRWSLAIALVWLAASLYRATDLAVHSLRLRRLFKNAVPVALDGRLQHLLAEAAAASGRGPVEVCTTTTLQRPGVIGFFRPRILIPEWLFARLTPGELEQIVLHEAEHLRRRDDWINLAQKLCLVLFPLNPALVWMERRLCREREMACDEGVVRITRAPRAYAACLASLAERGLERHVEALSLGAWQQRPELAYRVHSILRGKAGLGPLGARVLLSTLGCGLLVGSVELAHSPQLVAFVPERSAATANEPITPAPAAAATQREKTVARATREKQSPNDNGNVTATNVTLRQPSQVATQAANFSPATKAPTAMPLLAKSERHNAKKYQEEYIVLTTWQQVDTSTGNTGLKADYEIDTVAKNNSTTATAAQDPQMGSQITVTQLIFKVSPASAGSRSASKPAASPSTSQPRVASFHDGWLVFQL